MKSIQGELDELRLAVQRLKNEIALMKKKIGYRDDDEDDEDDEDEIMDYDEDDEEVKNETVVISPCPKNSKGLNQYLQTDLKTKMGWGWTSAPGLATHFETLEAAENYVSRYRVKPPRGRRFIYETV